MPLAQRREIPIISPPISPEAEVGDVLNRQIKVLQERFALLE
jgi:hypothetical protein